ncbi:hypothetical protein HHI36_010647, partial [Cryptolaemus montrouzieri]
ENSSSSQDEKIDETMPIKYNKKNNQKLRLLGRKYEGMKTIINDNDEKIVRKNVQKEEKGIKEIPSTHEAEKKTYRSFLCAVIDDNIRKDFFTSMD